MHISNLSIMAAMFGVALGLPQGHLIHDYERLNASRALETITMISTLPPEVPPPHQGLPESTLPFTPKCLVPSVRANQAKALETSMPAVTSITLHRGWPEHLETLRTTTRPVTDRYTSTTEPPAAVVPFVKGNQTMVLETSSPAVMPISLDQELPGYPETLETATTPTFIITWMRLPPVATTLLIKDTQAKPPSSNKGSPTCVRTIHPKPSTYCASYAHTTTITSSVDCKGCFPYVASAPDRYLAGNWPRCMSGVGHRETKTLKAYACKLSPPSMVTAA